MELSARSQGGTDYLPRGIFPETLRKICRRVEGSQRIILDEFPQFLRRQLPPTARFDLFDNLGCKTVANYFRRITGNDGIGRDGFGHHCARSDDGAPANAGRAGQDRRVMANPDVVGDVELGKRETVLVNDAQFGLVEICCQRDEIDAMISQEHIGCRGE